MAAGPGGPQVGACSQDSAHPCPSLGKAPTLQRSRRTHKVPVLWASQGRCRALWQQKVPLKGRSWQQGPVSPGTGLTPGCPQIPPRAPLPCSPCGLASKHWMSRYESRDLPGWGVDYRHSSPLVPSN